MVEVHPRYAKMKFKPYVFQEYPKWVTTAAGESKLCSTRADEIRLASNEGVSLSAEQQKEADYLKVMKEQQDALAAMRAEIEELKAAKAPATVSKDLPKSAVPETPAGKPVFKA